ncbi:MAG: hypothetical protein AB1467_05815 [Candidatus Diapherotrites archaeon]
MDLSHYIKKNRVKAGDFGAPAKRCLQCGKELERNESHLYYQSFCCEFCKQKYLSPKL